MLMTQERIRMRTATRKEVTPPQRPARLSATESPATDGQEKSESGDADKTDSTAGESAKEENKVESTSTEVRQLSSVHSHRLPSCL